MLKINNATAYAKFFISAFIEEGDTVIDATAGNGFDTVFLSKAVGKTGRVYAFDIQEQAIEKTKRRLCEEKCPNNAFFFNAGHEKLTDFFTGEISAAMFNLGFLPGARTSVMTTGETTLNALKQVLTLLKKGGAVSLCFYTGHQGGLEEYLAVAAYAKTLDAKIFDVLLCTCFNKAENSPVMMFIQKNLY